MLWEHQTQKEHTNDVISLSCHEYNQIPNVTLTLQGGHHFTIDKQCHFEPVKKDFNLKSLLWKEREFVSGLYLNKPNGVMLFQALKKFVLQFAKVLA